MRRPAPAGCGKLPMVAHSKCKRRPAMKQNNTVQRSPKRRAASSRGPITIGLDLGDRSSRYCRLDGQGEVVQEASVATTKKGLQLGVRRAVALPHRDRGGNALAVGEPAAGQAGPRGDRGQCEAGKADQPEQPQGRPAGRADAGAAGARRSAAAAADPPSERKSAAGSDGDPGPGGAGGGPHGADQLGARAGQSHGRAAAHVRRRQSRSGQDGGPAGRLCSRR